MIHHWLRLALEPTIALLLLLNSTAAPTSDDKSKVTVNELN